MAKAKVYWTDLRWTGNTSLLVKLERLLKAAGFGDLDLKDKYVAFKIHLGEPGNMAYIRPPYVGVVAAMVKKMGGKPFLTDSNTLYTGKRHNAFDHLRAGYENGFSYDSTGCDIIIADGLKGLDYVEMPVPQGVHCEKAKIGSAIAEADAVISLTHFKGHELTGFGGALKNLGMGSGSTEGKKFMHEVSHPSIFKEACRGCGTCVKSCASGAVTLGPDKKAHIDENKCVGCCQCVAVCPFNAARVEKGSESLVCGERIAEYAWSVIYGKPNFHASFVMNVSPNCDCWGCNDAPIVPDIGIFASADPVALDQACVDAVNAAVPLANSALTDTGSDVHDIHGDKFALVHPDTAWSAMLDHGAKIGMGTREYELKKV